MDKIAIFVGYGDGDNGGEDDGGLVVRRNQFLIRSNGCGKPIWPHNFSILLSCQGEERQCLDQNIYHRKCLAGNLKRSLYLYFSIIVFFSL